VLGTQLRYRPTARTSLGGVYQREIRTDRGGLYSERVGLDAFWRPGRGHVAGDLELDLATGDLNEARLRGQFPLPAGLTGQADVRRHIPFFELWTIWGAFSPRGFDEANVGLAWDAPLQGLSLQTRAGVRSYHPTPGAGVAGVPMREDGWRVEADGFWRPGGAARWTAYGRYGLEIGFGAARSEGDAGVRLQLGERGFVGANGSVFQMVREFRLDDGTVAGGGVDGGVRLTENLRLVGNVFAYRHRTDQQHTVDWTQVRGSLRADWTVGRDPGMANGWNGRGARGGER
jgi:hypothetical protein